MIGYEPWISTRCVVLPQPRASNHFPVITSVQLAHTLVWVSLKCLNWLDFCIVGYCCGWHDSQHGFPSNSMKKLSIGLLHSLHTKHSECHSLLKAITLWTSQIEIGNWNLSNNRLVTTYASPLVRTGNTHKITVWFFGELRFGWFLIAEAACKSKTLFMEPLIANGEEIIGYWLVAMGTRAYISSP